MTILEFQQLQLVNQGFYSFNLYTGELNRILNVNKSVLPSVG